MQGRGICIGTAQYRNETMLQDDETQGTRGSSGLAYARSTDAHDNDTTTILAASLASLGRFFPPGDTARCVQYAASQKVTMVGQGGDEQRLKRASGGVLSQTPDPTRKITNQPRALTTYLGR
jgi:hypothetical protein